MKKSILRGITSFMLVLSLVSMSSLTTLAAPSNDIDFELLAKAISQRYYVDLEMEKLGLDLNEMLELPKREGFFEEAENLLSDVKPISSGASRNMQALSEEVTIEAKRLKYAGEMATWSVSKNPNLDYDKEVLYMYLSHYIDVRQPLHSSNGISDNSKGPIYAKYITNSDRKDYTNYISRGSANKSAKRLTDLLVWVHGTGNDLKGVCEHLFEASKAANELVDLGTSLVLKVDDVKDFIESFNVYYSSGDSAEVIINKLNTDFEGRFGADKTKLMTKETIGFVGSVIGGLGPVAMYTALLDVQVDLGYTLMDEANFMALRSSYNFRLYDRLKYSYTVY
jgi:hypothetical protein